MHDWLQSASDKLGGVELTADEQRELLELARVAAHTSGDRRNAPLVTYMVGIARGRGDTRSVAEIVRDIDVA